MGLPSCSQKIVTHVLNYNNVIYTVVTILSYRVLGFNIFNDVTGQCSQCPSPDESGSRHMCMIMCFVLHNYHTST